MRKVKGTISILMVTALLVTLAVTNEPVGAVKKGKKETVRVSSVDIKNTGEKLRVQKGKKFVLETDIKVKPDKEKYKELKFTSSNRKVASVDSRGILKGLKVGTAKITAVSKNNRKKKASVSVSVTKDILVTSIKLNQTKVMADVSERQDIQLSVRKIVPSNAKNRKVEWSSSDKSIADVSKGGLVTIRNAGTAIVTAEASDHGGACAVCRIIVTEGKEKGTEPVSSSVAEQPSDQGGVLPSILPDVTYLPGSVSNHVTGTPAPERTNIPQRTGTPMTELPSMPPAPTVSAKPEEGQQNDTAVPKTARPTEMPKTERPTEEPKPQVTPGATNVPWNTKPPVTPVPKGYKDPNDVAALKKIVAEQQALGAMVSEDWDDTRQYIWDETGRLKKIMWGDKRFDGGGGEEGRDLKGDISFSSFTALRELGCAYNNLSSIDVSGCTNLRILNCTGNKLRSLDLGKNHDLETLDCVDNEISDLDVTSCTELKYLDCRKNELIVLDTSQNAGLVHLCCQENQLVFLDLRENYQLEVLYCENNRLKSLDVSQNPTLMCVSCSNNQLVSLEVGQNLVLWYLHCGDNQIKSLDLEGVPALRELYCYFNQLEYLDVSKCNSLLELWCQNNQLRSLDVSTNTELRTLMCYWNQLSSLDLSNNLLLENLSFDPDVILIGYDR